MVLKILKMRSGILIIILLQVSLLVYGQAENGTITLEGGDMSLPQLCDRILKSTGMPVFYDAEKVGQITVSTQAGSFQPGEALRIALVGSGFTVSEWNGGFVIHSGDTLPGTLPVFSGGITAGDLQKEASPKITDSEERYLTGRRADVAQTVIVGDPSQAAKSNSASIRGRITDLESGEPVIGATMYLEETRAGTATDGNGYLSMVLRPGDYTAVFEYMGMEKKKVLLRVVSDGEFDLEMKKSVIQMREVVVYGDRQMNIQMKEAGLEKITAKTIKEIPMLIGERDILKVSEMLPGIVTVGEGSAGLNVRGGNFDQNAFYINRIPVYSTSHLFGFFPAFNADIIKDFSIYKGYIPVRYGGRLSSIFNIIARQGNRKRFTARGGISPVAASLVVEGPLKKDVSSFIVSGRYLYSDWILGQIKDPLIRESSAGFNDLTAGLNYDFKKSQLSFFAYHSHDQFSLSDLSRYTYDNNGASLVFSHNFSASLRGEISLSGSRYDFSTADMQDASRAYRQSFSIGHYEAAVNLKKELNARNSLEFGGSVIRYDLDRGTVEPYDEASLRLPVVLGEERGMESSVFISDEWTIKPGITLSGGVRLMMFNPLGPSKVYTYADGGPKDPRYLTDSISYSRGEVIRWYFEPELRASLNIQTDEFGSVKIAFNQMHQNLFMLSNTVALAPNTQWKLADYHIRPASSNLFSAGIFRTLPGLGWETSLELYYRKTRNVTEFSDGADFTGNPLVETYVLQGKQDAYGLEFLLRRTGRRLEGWLAYTWSRSLVTVDGDYDWEKINSGQAYPSNYDIPHVFNAVINYHFNRRLTASSIITYQTGKPVTYPVSVYYVNGIPFVEYSDRNAYRIPDYFRIDLSLTIEGNLRRNKKLHNSLIFGIYNVTGRENPYSVYFTLENGKIKSYQYSVIGVPVFTVTWLFKLGNYASD
jgi:hypothetical protein